MKIVQLWKDREAKSDHTNSQYGEMCRQPRASHLLANSHLTQGQPPDHIRDSPPYKSAVCARLQIYVYAQFISISCLHRCCERFRVPRRRLVWFHLGCCRMLWWCQFYIFINAMLNGNIIYFSYYTEIRRFRFTSLYRIELIICKHNLKIKLRLSQNNDKCAR